MKTRKDHSKSKTPRSDAKYNFGEEFFGVPSPSESLLFARELETEIINLKRCVINARNAAEAIINGEKPLSIAEALLDNCNDTLDT